MPGFGRIYSIYHSPIPRSSPHLTTASYDLLIFRMTSLWYSTVLSLLPPSTMLLDIGVGNASSLLSPENVEVLKEKKLKVAGVDFTREYVEGAQGNIKRAGLEKEVKVVYGSVYDTKLLKSLVPSPRRKFDAAYFSGSISLLPDRVGALKSAASAVKKGGKIYVTQTYQKRTFPGLASLKRNLKYLTTIDFGELTMEAEILDVFERAGEGAGCRLASHEKVPGSVDNAMQAAYLSVLVVD